MGRALVGLFLVVVLAGLWWLWRAEGRGVAESAPLAEAAARSTSTQTPAPAVLADTEVVSVALAPAPPAAQRESVRSEPKPDAPAEPPARDDLLVEVVDPAGKPRPGVRLRLDRGTNEDVGSVPGPLVTDAGGRALFPGVRPWLENAVQPWTLRHELLPFEKPPDLTLDRAILSAPRVVSVLPWGGALEVVVRDLGDEPAPEGSTVKIKLLAQEELLSPVPSGPDWEGTLRSGVALFPWVELGRTWQVSAWRPDGTIPSRVRTRGPFAAEETVRVEIVLGADHPLASFRAVDVAGKPFASVPLELLRRRVFGSSSTTRVTTDADGRFTVDGEATPFDRASFVVTYRRESVLQGLANLPASPKIGWNDGGDVVLAAEPLLCAGRVVDEAGNPVAGARIEAGDSSYLARRVGPGRRVRSGTGIEGASDERGLFELRGLREDTFAVRAEEGSRRSDTLRARQGERDLVLVLPPRYTVSGRLLVDAGIDPRSIRFQWKTPAAEPVSADRDPSHEDGPDGSFTLEPVRAGEYELLCLLERVELARVEHLSIHADTDVGTIDLGGRIHACEIALLGAEDPGKLKGEFDWTPRGEDEHTRGRFEGRLVKILTATVPIDVDVRPYGYRLARLEDLVARREVVLEAPVRVRLVLRTDGELPVLPYVFFCDVKKGDMDVGEARGMRYFTKDSREIEMDVAAVGPLRVHWHLERRVEGANMGGARGANVLGGREVDIEVLDVPGEQVLTIPLDGAALTALAHDPPW